MNRIRELIKQQHDYIKETTTVLCFNSLKHTSTELSDIDNYREQIKSMIYDVYSISDKIANIMYYFYDLENINKSYSYYESLFTLYSMRPNCIHQTLTLIMFYTGLDKLTINSPYGLAIEYIPDGYVDNVNERNYREVLDLYMTYLFGNNKYKNNLPYEPHDKSLFSINTNMVDVYIDNIKFLELVNYAYHNEQKFNYMGIEYLISDNVYIYNQHKVEQAIFDEITKFTMNIMRISPNQLPHIVIDINIDY